MDTYNALFQPAGDMFEGLMEPTKDDSELFTQSPVALIGMLALSLKVTGAVEFCGCIRSPWACGC